MHFAEYRNDEYGYFWDRSLGYTKVSREWGLAIRTRAGYYDDESLSVEEWRFNDAPRSHRLEALEKLPELIEQLAQAAKKTAGELKHKVAITKQVATTISQMAPSNPARRK